MVGDEGDVVFKHEVKRMEVLVFDKEDLNLEMGREKIGEGSCLR